MTINLYAFLNKEMLSLVICAGYEGGDIADKST